ncbi:MAG TPA: LysR family transcriptional regulator [Xanthobacteraceae bacterium]|jgi:DNA-binding transcriptional LysR family regulator
MLNIPTELLRALVTVSELRSFTRAAQALGVTQPAVSAQIKRLQHLLGYEILDKSAPGVTLTPRGEIVVNNARRLLAVNDEILQMASGHAAGPTIRVGIPRDYAGARLPGALAKFRERWPGVSYNVSSQGVDDMLRDLKQGELDLVLAVFAEAPKIAARHIWTDEPVWVRSSATRLDPARPVPLVSYGEESACQRLAVTALYRAGLDCNFVFTAHSLVSQTAAVEAGFGVMVMPRSRAARNHLDIWDDGPLPKLPQLYGAICIREGADGSAIAELADYINDQIQDTQARGS